VRATPARAVVAFGGLALAVATVDFGLYVTELVSGGPSQLAVAVLERIATALLLAGCSRSRTRPPTEVMVALPSATRRRHDQSRCQTRGEGTEAELHGSNLRWPTLGPTLTS
jgi:hypothetical protein